MIKFKCIHCNTIIKLNDLQALDGYERYSCPKCDASYRNGGFCNQEFQIFDRDLDIYITITPKKVFVFR
jgi:DNA-directed RNA polymerase subunit RPC12/RpoP